MQHTIKKYNIINRFLGKKHWKFLLWFDILKNLYKLNSTNPWLLILLLEYETQIKQMLTMANFSLLTKHLKINSRKETKKIEELESALINNYKNNFVLPFNFLLQQQTSSFLNTKVINFFGKIKNARYILLAQHKRIVGKNYFVNTQNGMQIVLKYTPNWPTNIKNIDNIKHYITTDNIIDDLPTEFIQSKLKHFHNLNLRKKTLEFGYKIINPEFSSLVFNIPNNIFPSVYREPYIQSNNSELKSYINNIFNRIKNNKDFLQIDFNIAAFILQYCILGKNSLPVFPELPCKKIEDTLAYLYLKVLNNKIQQKKPTNEILKKPNANYTPIAILFISINNLLLN